MLGLSLAIPSLRGSRRSTDLIGPGFLSPLFAFTRAQAGGARSTALGADGVTWQEFGADVPRFSGSARRLVVEGQTTGLIANARTPGGAGWVSPGLILQGAVAGPDGGAASANLVQETTATEQHRTISETFPTVTGQLYTHSFFVRAGTCPTVQIAHGLTNFGSAAWANFDLAAGTVGPTGAAVVRAEIRGPFNGWYWIQAAAPATVTSAAGQSQLATLQTINDGRSPSFAGTSRTIEVSWSWIEERAPGTTAVLPPVGAPAQATRGADIISAPYSALFPGGVGTIVAECLLPFGGLAGGADRLIVELSDGTANNRIRLRANPQATALTAGRVIGGVSADAPSLGTIAPGSVFRVAMTWDGAQVRACLAGQPEQVVAGVPAGLNVVRVGNTVSNFGPLNGEIGTFRAIPAATPAGGLPALLNAL